MRVAAVASLLLHGGSLLTRGICCSTGPATSAGGGADVAIWSCFLCDSATAMGGGIRRSLRASWNEELVFSFFRVIQTRCRIQNGIQSTNFCGLAPLKACSLFNSKMFPMALLPPSASATLTMFEMSRILSPIKCILCSLFLSKILAARPFSNLVPDHKCNWLFLRCMPPLLPLPPHP